MRLEKTEGSIKHGHGGRRSGSGRRRGVPNKITSDLLRGHTDTMILRLLAEADRYGYEIVKLIAEHHWRVAEEPVEILYTEYSMSKGQPLLNGVNIVFDGFLRGRMRR